ncbi:hypothetical protein ACOMHN_026998 [Nucella lapillus]
MASSRRLHQLQLILKRLHSHQSSITPTTPLQQGVIQVTPKVSRFDQKVHIKVKGLPKEVKVTLHASTKTEWRRRTVPYMSCGHYVTNAAGEVDLWKDASVGGSYQGVEPMGLFWSMRASPSSPQNSRMVVKDVVQPVTYHLSLHLDHLTIEHLEQHTMGMTTGATTAQGQQGPVSSVSLKRLAMSPGVTRLPVKEGSVRGTFFLPPGEGPFPGVLDLFGLAGGLMECRAAMLASHGFAALALPIFGYDDLPKDLRNQNFEYYENAVNWLSSLPSVKTDSIGVMGTSGGAALAMIMGWKCPQVKAVVRINGGGIMSLVDMRRNGELLLPGIGIDLHKLSRKEGGLVLKEAWQYQGVTEGFIPLWEREDVHLLVLVSDDDQLLPAIATDLQHELYPQDNHHLLQVVHYPRAGHLLEPPYTPLCRVCYNTYFDEDLLWGGYVKDHAVAQEDSWRRILQCFEKHLSS